MTYPDLCARKKQCRHQCGYAEPKLRDELAHGEDAFVCVSKASCALFEKSLLYLKSKAEIFLPGIAFQITTNVPIK